ncbi:hypothetical protein EYF80_041101 [Liparis tanakae]|uniref:Uncharacterized protein n=1 Tax=Liparis tanakae TaxID=230148 RepID=A0A4Z2G6Z1_9TELE|nr:hypothetical protein EYF80_041101 [Liparis tanakae]
MGEPLGGPHLEKDSHRDRTGTLRTGTTQWETGSDAAQRAPLGVSPSEDSDLFRAAPAYALDQQVITNAALGSVLNDGCKRRIITT